MSGRPRTNSRELGARLLPVRKLFLPLVDVELKVVIVGGNNSSNMGINMVWIPQLGCRSLDTAVEQLQKPMNFALAHVVAIK